MRISFALIDRLPYLMVSFRKEDRNYERTFYCFWRGKRCWKVNDNKKIYDRLCFEGREIVLTKEPSNTKMGLLSREIANEIAGKSLACLVASDRFYHVENIILPEINKGKIVLSDRNILSAFVFNKMDGISFEYTERLYEGITYPKVIILLYASPQIVYERLKKRDELTRYKKVRIGYEQEVINESVRYLRKRNIEIYEVSTEVSEIETTKRVYDIINQYSKL